MGSDNAKEIPVGMKRRRGRPKKTLAALEKQDEEYVYSDEAFTASQLNKDSKLSKASLNSKSTVPSKDSNGKIFFLFYQNLKTNKSIIQLYLYKIK